MSGADAGATGAEFTGASRLAALISPLRWHLLGAARAAAQLPGLPDARIEVIRALPRGTVKRPGELAGSLGLSRSTEVIATPKALDLFTRFDDVSATIVGNALLDLPETDRTTEGAA